ncbi:UNVERIFIED_CONTAM: hypothetical protein FKN15_030255 [Acipenser sinensis]
MKHLYVLIHTSRAFPLNPNPKPCSKALDKLKKLEQFHQAKKEVHLNTEGESSDSDSQGSADGILATGRSFLKSQRSSQTIEEVDEEEQRETSPGQPSDNVAVSISRDSLEPEDSVMASGPGPSAVGFGMDTLDEEEEKERFFANLERGASSTIDYSKLNKELDSTGSTVIATLRNNEKPALEKEENKEEKEDSLPKSTHISADYSEDFEEDAGGREDQEIVLRPASSDHCEKEKHDQVEYFIKLCTDTYSICRQTLKYGCSTECYVSLTPAQRSSPSPCVRALAASSPHGSVPRETGQQLLPVITTDIWVLTTVQTSYSLQFKHGPPPFRGMNVTSVTDPKDAVVVSQEGSKKIGMLAKVSLLDSQESKHSTGSEKDDGIMKVVSYGQSASEIEALQEAYRKINHSLGDTDVEQKPLMSESGKNISFLHTLENTRDTTQNATTESGGGETVDTGRKIPSKTTKSPQSKMKNTFGDTSAAVRSSGYGKGGLSTKQLLPVGDKKTVNKHPQKMGPKGRLPAEKATSKLKGGMSQTQIFNSTMTKCGLKMDSGLFASVHSFAGYLQQQIDRSIKGAGQIQDHMIESSGNAIEELPKHNNSPNHAGNIQREISLLQRAEEAHERLSTEHSLVEKLKAELQQKERELQHRDEELRLKHEKEVFELKQENYIIQTKLHSIEEANKKNKWVFGDPADPITEQKLKLIEKEVKEQEILIQGYHQKEEAKLMEEVRRLKQDKQSLEVDLVHMQKERDLAKAQVIHTSGDKTFEMKIMEDQYKQEICGLKKRLQWYAENQDLLDKDTQRLIAASTEIQKLKDQVEKLKTEVRDRNVQQQRKFKERVGDAKRIQDLERQVKEMEDIIRRRHPNSLPALIFAAASATSGEGDASSKSDTVSFLEKRITRLEADLEGKDEEAKKSLRAMEQQYQKIKQQRTLGRRRQQQRTLGRRRQQQRRGTPGHGGGSGSSTSLLYPVTGGSPGNAEQQAAPDDAEQQAAPGDAEQQAAPGDAEQQAALPQAMQSNRQAQAMQCRATGSPAPGDAEQQAALPQAMQSNRQPCPRRCRATGSPAPGDAEQQAALPQAMQSNRQAQAMQGRYPWAVRGRHPWAERGRAGAVLPMTVEVEPAGIHSLLVEVEMEPAGIHPLLVEVGGASRTSRHSPSAGGGGRGKQNQQAFTLCWWRWEGQAEPAGIHPLLVEVGGASRTMAPLPLVLETMARAPLPLALETEAMAPLPLALETAAMAPLPLAREMAAMAPLPLALEMAAMAPLPLALEMAAMAPLPLALEMAVAGLFPMDLEIAGALPYLQPGSGLPCPQLPGGTLGSVAFPRLPITLHLWPTGG